MASDGAPGESDCGASRRTTCPTALRFGQSRRAMVSDTTTTPASAVRSACVKPRPLTTSMSSTSKYSGDTAIWSTGNSARRPAVASAETDVSATARVGCDDAATAATNGWAVTAWSSAARRGSLAIETLTVSLVRTPGSTVAAAKAPRRNMAAQIRRRADAPTWTAIRACRARPGRASLVTSPRIVRTSSRRVACSAGASPKNTVETMAPATRNTSTRQSAAGARTG